MFTNFKIDQAGTFQGIAFLSCDPKTAFKSDRQETTKDGTPKWDVQAVAMTRDMFGRPQNAVLKVGIASHKNPCEGLMPYTPIQLVNFEIGVMEKTKRNPDTGEEKVIGVQVWYRAEQVKALAGTAPVK
ncbi:MULTISPECIES: hypothetical protein [unclassified Micromonospora]|uniref:hypothetical protein n=1 Tax=unclassified Micromonospora TaxID=2617518 RepID=UPI00098D2275|nr:MULTISPECIES: hypothetical protein [unclassified Micromonospora]MDI5937937.1 hypothetical protein [Micromonospora sp. DH15]OON27052.1 hypothetical protein BSA16_34000 [Micromonospora sp. Rc5]